MNRLKKAGVCAAVLALAGTLTACSSGTKSADGGAVFTTVSGTNAITPGAPMNPFNASGNYFLSFNTMQLGWDKKNPSNPNDFFPGLAKSWKTTDTSVTIELQSNAKWSDGTAVTPDDIKLSMAIALTQGTATVGAGFLLQGLDVGAVKVIDPHTVEIDQAPGGKNLNFTRLVLQQKVVPTKVFGSLVPADIWTTIAATVDPDATKAKAAVDALNTAGKAISAFAPDKDVSAGPFVLTRVNPGSAVLDRNPNFYDVAKIAPKQVVLRHYTGNEQIWGFMKAAELDAAPYTAIPTNVLDQILKAGNARLDSLNYVNAAIAFNESVAPYDQTAVRQALAYVIDREAVTKVGEPVGGTASKNLTGMIDAASNQWLTPDQVSALNPYKPDTAKAETLLKGAGFTKDGNQWKLPDGKPWKITLQTVNGFSDWISAGTVVASELTAFGIPTEPAVTADFATYKTEMAAGKYAVGFWLTALGPQTSAAYQRLYGVDDGFSPKGADVTHVTGKGSGNWINTPATYTVNGTTINPGALTTQLDALDPAGQKPLVQQLAIATNQELPMIPIWDYTKVQFTLDKRFTNFPKAGQDDLLNNPPGVWMMQGYVQAK